MSLMIFYRIQKKAIRMIKSQRQKLNNSLDEPQIAALVELQTSINTVRRDVILFDQLLHKQRSLGDKKISIKIQLLDSKQDVLKMLGEKQKLLSEKQAEYENMKTTIINRTQILKQKQKQAFCLKENILEQQTQVHRLGLERDQKLDKQQKLIKQIQELNKDIEQESIKKIANLQKTCISERLTGQKRSLLTQIGNMQRVQSLLLQVCQSFIN